MNMHYVWLIRQSRREPCEQTDGGGSKNKDRTRWKKVLLDFWNGRPTCLSLNVCVCVPKAIGRWHQPLIFPVRLPCWFTQKSRWTVWDLEYWALRTSDSAEERVSVWCPLHTTSWSKREISCDLSFAIAKCAVSKSERILCKAFSLIKSKQHGGKKHNAGATDAPAEATEQAWCPFKRLGA